MTTCDPYAGHSYGHGSTCFYCGCDADTEDDKPCDESVRKKPTEAERAAWEEQSALGGQIVSVGIDVECGLLTFDQALEKIRGLRPRTTQAPPQDSTKGEPR